MYDIATRVASRMTFGSTQHHPALASFYGLIGLHSEADKQRQNAKKEFARKLWVDELITLEGKYPIYNVPNIQTIGNYIAHTSADEVKKNSAEWLKKSFEIQEQYEKGTLKLFEELKQQADAKTSKLLDRLIQAVKDEIEDIEADKAHFAKFDFDIKKIKGENTMNPYHPHHVEHEHEMRRRRHHAAYPMTPYPAYPYMDYPHHEEHPVGYEMPRHRHYRHHRMDVPHYVPHHEPMHMEHDGYEHDMRRHRRHYR